MVRVGQPPSRVDAYKFSLGLDARTPAVFKHGRVTVSGSPETVTAVTYSLRFRDWQTNPPKSLGVQLPGRGAGRGEGRRSAGGGGKGVRGGTPGPGHHACPQRQQ